MLNHFAWKIDSDTNLQFFAVLLSWGNYKLGTKQFLSTFSTMRSDFFGNG